jgi:hypothetical protein
MLAPLCVTTLLANICSIHFLANKIRRASTKLTSLVSYLGPDLSSLVKLFVNYLVTQFL